MAGMRWMRTPLSIGALAFGSCLVGAGLAEVALRAVECRDCWYVWPPHLRATLHPSPVLLPGVYGPSTFTTNSWGMRGDPVPRAQAYVVVAMGGSGTECLYQDDLRAWPHVLQQLLSTGGQTRMSVWVGNAGRSGLNSRHNVVQVEKLLREHPHIDAIVMLVGVNDLLYRLAADTTYRSNWEISPGLIQITREAFPARFPDDSTLPFYKRTGLWRLLHLVRERLRPEVADLQFRQDERGAGYAHQRLVRRAALRVRDSLPDLKTALTEYRANLLRIVATARQHGTRLILLTQPSLWRPDLSARSRSLLWMGGVGTFPSTHATEFYSATALMGGMKRYNDELLSVCAATRAECIDLAAAIPKDTTMFYDDAHLNDGGAQRAAEIIASYMLARPRFGSPSRRSM